MKGGGGGSVEIPAGSEKKDSLPIIFRSPEVGISVIG